MYTILGIIANPLGILLDLLYSVINNYGITIIVFTVIVKLCLYPLYIKQTKSTAKMSEVQPKMQALQRKYANDKETLNIKWPSFTRKKNSTLWGMSSYAHTDAYHNGSLCSAQKSDDVYE